MRLLLTLACALMISVTVPTVATADDYCQGESDVECLDEQAICVAKHKGRAVFYCYHIIGPPL